MTRSLTPYQVNERENEKLTDPPMTPVGRVGSPPKPPWVESQMGFQASTGWPLSLGLSSCSSTGAVQVWSLTQFYSVDFSQLMIGVKKCVFNKRTIKVCVSSVVVDGVLGPPRLAGHT